MVETIFQDVRYGFRILRKTPGFTAVAVLTLALGIGASVAIFSAIDVVLLRPLPYEKPQQLVTVTETLPLMGQDEIGVSAGEYQDYRDRNRSFSQVAAYESDGFNLTGAGQPLRINAAKISASAFPLLGVSPEIGRTFTEAEERSGAVNLIVLSHKLWQNSYNSDPNILGKTLKLNEQPYTVIGVMPDSFRFPFDGAPLSEMADLWMPIAFDPALLAPENRIREFGVGLIGRLKPGVTLAQAQQDVLGIANAFMHQYGYEGTLRVVPKVYGFSRHTSEKARPFLWLLALAVASVFLISCANVANLLLARASQRQHEIAVRSAIGATHLRILRQSLVESILLAIVGASGGIAIAEGLIVSLQRFGPADVPRLHAVSIHPLALAFALGLSLFSVFIFGVVPAWRLSRTAPVCALRESTTAGPAHGTQKIQHAITVVEVALAVVLLTCAGLLLKSFVRLLNTSSGFNPQGTFIVRTIFDRQRYPDPAKRRAVQQQLLSDLAQVPGVTAVAAASHLPLSDTRQIGFRLEHAAPDDFHWAQNSLISPGYFHAMGIALMKGRDFVEQDQPDGLSVAIVSESFAKAYFPVQEAIGKRFYWGGRGMFTIVGIAADVHISALNDDPPPMIYYSMFQVNSGPSDRAAFVVRTNGEMQGLLAAIQRKVWSVDKDLPLYNSTTLATLISESVAQKRFTTILLEGFAAIALLLSAVGLFGVISYLVAERTREFGVRIALGAGKASIYAHVLRHATYLVAWGCVCGIVGSLFGSSLLQTSLYQVSRFDLTTLIFVPVILLAVALFAAFWPARRAAKVDPMVALRYE